MRYLGTLSPNWPRKLAEDMQERQAYWRVRAAIGPVWPDDFGKRVYESDGIVQVENGEQRDERLNRESLSRYETRTKSESYPRGD